MSKIQLKNIFGQTVDCYVSNIADKGYYWCKKHNLDLICCWWCGNWSVHEFERADGRKIAVAQLER